MQGFDMRSLSDLITYQDKISELADLYKEYSNPKQTGLNTDLESHLGFVGTKQWVFTNPDIIDFNLLDAVNLNTKTWAVIINIELVHKLINLGVHPKNIFFYSDNKWRATWAQHIICGLPPENIFMLPTNRADLKSYTKMNNKKVDYVLNNVPFGMFKEFKELSLSLAKEKALIISGARDYNNSKSFENVEYYKYLGNKAFPTAQIIASLAIINPAGTADTNIVDKDGNLHTVSTSSMQAPGEDIEGWLLATEVAALNLPGYKAQMGSLYFDKVIEDPNGAPCIFTVGEANKPTEFGRTKKINSEDLKQTKGLGEHKLVISKTGTTGKLGAMKYAGPEYAVGFGTYFISFDSEQQVIEAINYCNTPAVEKLVKGVKPNTVVNGQGMWKQIPQFKYANQWIHLAS